MRREFVELIEIVICPCCFPMLSQKAHHLPLEHLPSSCSVEARARLPFNQCPSAVMSHNLRQACSVHIEYIFGMRELPTQKEMTK
jgi:hypothetical protein